MSTPKVEPACISSELINELKNISITNDSKAALLIATVAKPWKS